MNSVKKKIILSFLPFFLLLGSFLAINIFSTIQSPPLDQYWSTRQLIIGLFMFTSLSFLPSLLQISSQSEFPFVNINLSHHTLEIRNSHEIKFKDYSFCTGCFGTIISILLANLTLLIYFLGDTTFFNIQTYFSLFYAGVILVIVTYSRYFKMLSPKVRLIQHSALILGLSLLVISCDLYYQSAFFMVFLFPSWFTFLFARIQLSKLEHKL